MKSIETVGDLITSLLKYRPDAPIRHLTDSGLGMHIKMQHHDSCVYTTNADSKIDLTNNKDSQTLISSTKKIAYRDKK